MLKPAFQYKEKLQTAYGKIIFQDKYKYYNSETYWSYQLKLSEDSWNDMDFVSVDKEDNVIGYLRCHISRTSDKVSSLGIMNFTDRNMTFGIDLHRFLIDLFNKYNFRKIEWGVTVGNPAEQMYDRIVKKYGGRIVGIKKQTTRLQDGQYYDDKLYEIFKVDYLNAKERRQ